MNIDKFKHKPFTYWLFLISGLIFLLSITKHFIFESSAETSFYVLELASFFIFLILLIFTEKQYASYRENIRNLEKLIEVENKVWQTKYNILKEKLAANESTDERDHEILIQQEKIIKKIFEPKKDNIEKRSFLHHFSEATYAVAAIMYSEIKPSNEFTVRECYGLPEGFSPSSFTKGEGLCGQAALEGLPIVIDKIPNDYLDVTSGLGNAKPTFLYLLPIMKDKYCVGLIELATFKKIDLEKMWPAISAKIIDKEVL